MTRGDTDSPATPRSRTPAVPGTPTVRTTSESPHSDVQETPEDECEDPGGRTGDRTDDGYRDGVGRDQRADAEAHDDCGEQSPDHSGVDRRPGHVHGRALLAARVFLPGSGGIVGVVDCFAIVRTGIASPTKPFPKSRFCRRGHVSWRGYVSHGRAASRQFRIRSESTTRSRRRGRRRIGRRRRGTVPRPRPRDLPRRSFRFPRRSVQATSGNMGFSR